MLLNPWGITCDIFCDKYFPLPTLVFGDHGLNADNRAANVEALLEDAPEASAGLYQYINNEGSVAHPYGENKYDG